jgi:hypothetical protein
MQHRPVCGQIDEAAQDNCPSYPEFRPKWGQKWGQQQKCSIDHRKKLPCQKVKFSIDLERQNATGNGITSRFGKCSKQKGENYQGELLRVDTI